VELETVTLTIKLDQCGPLLSSARDLISVKVDAIEHAKRGLKKGLSSLAEIERHRAELAEVERLAHELDRLARGARGEELTARRSLVDEIVVSALITESQELADSIVGLTVAGSLADVATRLTIVNGLVGMLADARS
jgi:hypothetical protein